MCFLFRDFRNFCSLRLSCRGVWLRRNTSRYRKRNYSRLTTFLQLMSWNMRQNVLEFMCDLSATIADLTKVAPIAHLLPLTEWGFQLSGTRWEFNVAETIPPPRWTPNHDSWVSGPTSCLFTGFVTFWITFRPVIHWPRVLADPMTFVFPSVSPSSISRIGSIFASFLSVFAAECGG